MNRETVLHRLAEQLEDRELERIFPGTPPSSIRDILLGKSVPTAPSSSAHGQKKGKETLAECTLYTDGASRGNPGLAGAGMVLLDSEGGELLARSEFLGTCTNNQAEYRALVLGLQSALEIGCRRLHIRLDSELIVRQLTGRYKVKNAALKPLFTETQRLLKQFKGYTVGHVPRARNKRADELANRGIDERQRN